MPDLRLNNSNIRINYHGSENFIDIETRDDWATTIWNLDEFNYWVVIRFTDGRYSPHQVICVPTRDWFTDWAEKNKGLFEIVYSPHPEDNLTSRKEPHANHK